MFYAFRETWLSIDDVWISKNKVKTEMNKDRRFFG